MTAEEFAALMPDATQIESCEPELESTLHYAQLALLVTCLEWLWRERNDFFIGANLTIYFSRQQLKSRDFRGPDFFLVKNAENRPRRSWVTWEEGGQYPNLIIELLSDATAETDKNLKKELYQSRFKTYEYFYFSPETLEFAGFRLVNQSYQAIAANPQGQLWSEELELYLGIYQEQLRYFSVEGRLMATPQEAALRAQERANQLAEQLRQLGVEPE